MRKQFRIDVNDKQYLMLLKPEHARELFDLIEANREYLRKWLPWLDNNKYLQNSIDFIKICEKQYRENKSLQLGIFYEGVLCGMLGLHNIDWINHSVNIGYWLGERFQGGGIVTAGCAALIDYCFNSLGINRIEIRCAPGNNRSRAIPENLGFHREGVARQVEWLYDGYLDHVVYSMLKSEWKYSWP